MFARDLLKAIVILGIIGLLFCVVYLFKKPLVGYGQWNLPVTSFTDLTELKRGDLIFWQSDSFISNILSQCLRTPFTHISMVWGGGNIKDVTVIDCDVYKGKSGVHVWSLVQKMSTWSGDHIAVLQLKEKLSYEEQCKIFSVCDLCTRKVTGFTMDTLYALNSIFFKSRTIHDRCSSRSQFFCSEFITYVLQNADLIKKDFPRSFLTPVDYWFRNSEELRALYMEPKVLLMDEVLLSEPIDDMINRSVLSKQASKGPDGSGDMQGIVPKEGPSDILQGTTG